MAVIQSRVLFWMCTIDNEEDVYKLCDPFLQFPVPAPVLVVDANKDIADMRQLFETISAEIVDQSDKDKLPEEVVEDKENTPEKSMGTKRSCDQKENVERSKKQTVLSNVN